MPVRLPPRLLRPPPRSSIPLQPSPTPRSQPWIVPPPPLTLRHRAFTSSRVLLHEDLSRRNHYERLNVQHDASHSDIKKSFYRLSKAHHPDTNPDNPNASHTFSLISESYGILSDPPRRAAYDRDVLRLHQNQGAAPQPRGSYHSAGGRPATGLSRRRTTFRGPPPSFYRNGGWGSHTEKRRRAHEESTSSSTDGRPRYDGMGPGDDPFGHHDHVPHFDSRSHERTQRREDDRRWRRAHRMRRAVDDEDTEFEPQLSIGAHFIVILTLLTVSILVPGIYLGWRRSRRRKRELERMGGL